MSLRRFHIALSVGIGLALFANTLEAAKLYKWVDEQGNVHYSDTVPPDEAKHAREELNAQGVTVKATDRARTAEEQAAIDKAEEDARLAALDADERRRRDKALLDSYASESDLNRSYNQRVDLLNQTIEARKVEIGLREQGMTKLVAQAAETERAGKPVPDALKQMIDSERKEIDRQREFVGEKQIELVSAKSEYEEQLERYREVAARYAESNKEQ